MCGKPPTRITAVLTLFLVVAAGAMAACGGSGKAEKATPSATVTAPPPALSGAGSQPTPLPPTATPIGADHRIEAGEWDFAFKVISNSCGGDPVPGTMFDFAYFLESLSQKQDGFIVEGQPMRVTHLGGTYVGNTVFTWPLFSFDYPIDGGHAYVAASFDSPTTGKGSLTESYTTDGGDTCSVFLRDDGQ